MCKGFDSYNTTPVVGLMVCRADPEIELWDECRSALLIYPGTTLDEDGMLRIQAVNGAWVYRPVRRVESGLATIYRWPD